MKVRIRKGLYFELQYYNPGTMSWIGYGNYPSEETARHAAKELQSRDLEAEAEARIIYEGEDLS